METQILFIAQRSYEKRGRARYRVWIASARRHLHQWACGLRGHEALLRLEPDRICLECAVCGYQTPGWDLTVTHAVKPGPSVELDPQRIKPETLRRCAAVLLAASLLG